MPRLRNGSGQTSVVQSRRSDRRWFTPQRCSLNLRWSVVCALNPGTGWVMAARNGVLSSSPPIPSIVENPSDRRGELSAVEGLLN
jgi:hypothetical protein